MVMLYVTMGLGERGTYVQQHIYAAGDLPCHCKQPFICVEIMQSNEIMEYA